MIGYITILSSLILFSSVTHAHWLKLEINPKSGVQYIHFGGMIDTDPSREIQAIESKIDYKTPTVLYILGSSGGATDYAKQVSDMLKKIQARLDSSRTPAISYVQFNCNSACALPFLAFRNRAMDARATLGFHSSHEFGKMKPSETQKFVGLLVQNGLSAEWIKSNKRMFEQMDITSVSAFDLNASKSGVFKSSAIIISPDQIDDYLINSGVTR